MGLESVRQSRRVGVGRSVVVGSAMVVFGLVWVPMLSVGAQEFDIVIPVDTIVRAPEGSITPLATIDVPAEAQGQTCEAQAQSHNPGSVHPDNDLIVASGSSQIVLPDVEGVAGGTVDGVGELTLGETIVVSLRMGPDEVFSAGINVIIDCTSVETTTTTEVEETTTTTVDVGETTVTTVPETTTTTEPEDEVLGTTVTTQPQETTTTIEDEVLAEELPFTGVDRGALAIVAAVLGSLGLLVALSARRVEE